MHDHFAVSAGPESMSLGTKLSPQFHVIVDFAVGDQHQRLVLVENRLLPSLDIDDAQPPHRQSNGSFMEDPLPIRSSMDQSCVHTRDARHRLRREWFCCYGPGYPTHIVPRISQMLEESFTTT